MKNSTFLILFLFPFFILMSCESNSNKKIKSEEIVINEDINSNKRMNTIIFFGNSLTAGYGLEKEASFPAVIQRTYDSLQINYNCINAGLSGETTAGGNERVEWILSQNTPDIFVLALGGNDALRGISPDNTKTNLNKIIDKVRMANPNCKILLAGIVPPPNMGKDYFNAFQQVFPSIAKEKDTFLLKFLLENVAGEPTLNQKDGIHPNKDGAKIVADNVMKALTPLL